MSYSTFVLGTDLRTTILTSAADTDGRHDFTDNFNAAGSRTPLHAHTRYDERFWIIEGTLTVWAGRETVTLRPGDYFAIPMQVPHALQAGPEGVRALQISSPAGFAELISRVGTPAELATPDTPFDVELFTKLATEMGDVILGPPGAVPADLTDDAAG
ncbi:cupin domain-containing protein [Cryptosporangium sp. NPDC048952]|uniref:cupin domain-containing protein n=1 Tax=Cryptosporangium sp. NPDC048952 TaxID=3363961 RepID=UPI00371A0601